VLIVELLVVIALTLLNGLLALSELALVSSRRSKLKTMANQRKFGAESALALTADPGRFLSTVQIGITLVGVLSGAFSGSTLGLRLADFIESFGVPDAYGEPIGVGIVVVLITYLSVIVGELVPKQIALRDPEKYASRMAPLMTTLSRVSGPVVTLLDVSGDLVLKIIGINPDAREKVTDEEIRSLIAEAETAGVIEPEERSMIAGVMRLADRPVSAVMTPRNNVDMVDLDWEVDKILKVIDESEHSRFPAYRTDSEKIVGILQSKELLDAFIARGGDFDPRDYLRKAPNVPDTVGALDAIEMLKASPVHMGLVHDEYGQFKGVVTTADILEAIAGVFRTEESPAAKAKRRDDGTWFLDGNIAADEFSELLGVQLPEDRTYQTLAGFLLQEMGRLPDVGEHVVAQGWRFEVVDLDGKRIDKVMAKRVPEARRRRKKAASASTPPAKPKT
jgi:putative hemolysin